MVVVVVVVVVVEVEVVEVVVGVAVFYSHSLICRSLYCVDKFMEKDCGRSNEQLDAKTLWL